MTAEQQQCRYCCHIFSGDWCPKCEDAHAKFSRSDRGGDYGRKFGAPSLDMQEGNWEEWQ